MSILNNSLNNNGAILPKYEMNNNLGAVQLAYEKLSGQIVVKKIPDY
jgi:hypothetical protein